MDNPGRLLLISSLSAMLGAQIWKVMLHRLHHKIWNWRLVFETGGMPSSHSALMTALTVSMWLFYGWKSPWFAVAFVSSIVVMYDAIGVRRQAGELAMILEDLLEQERRAGVLVSDAVPRSLRHWKRQGHTPREVVGGIGVGAIVALVTFWAA